MCSQSTHICLFISRCPLQHITVAWFTFCSAILLNIPLSTLVAAATDDDEAYAQAMMQPLNSMLNWGVANSDPEELKRIADMVAAPAADTIAIAATLARAPIGRVVVHCIC